MCAENLDARSAEACGACARIIHAYLCGTGNADEISAMMYEVDAVFARCRDLALAPLRDGPATLRPFCAMRALVVRCERVTACKDTPADARCEVCYGERPTLTFAIDATTFSMCALHGRIIADAVCLFSWLPRVRVASTVAYFDASDWCGDYHARAVALRAAVEAFVSSCRE